MQRHLHRRSRHAKSQGGPGGCTNRFILRVFPAAPHPDPFLTQSIFVAFLAVGPRRLTGTSVARLGKFHQAELPIHLRPRRAPLNADGDHASSPVTLRPTSPADASFSRLRLDWSIARPSGGFKWPTRLGRT